MRAGPDASNLQYAIRFEPRFGGGAGGAGRRRSRLRGWRWLLRAVFPLAFLLTFSSVR